MALIYKDRVRQTCAAPTGSDPFDFDVSGGTPAGYQSFADTLSTGDTCVYGAEDPVGNWEIGLGTWNDTTNSLTRTTIYSSSNSGFEETFAAGVTVFITIDAQHLVTSPNWRDVDWASFKLQNVFFQNYGEISSSPSISAGAITFNLANGNVFLVSLNASITSITISNAPSSPKCGNFVVVFTADGTLRTISWGASITFAGGIVPGMTATNGKKDIISFLTVDGSTWFATMIGQNF